MDQQRRDEYKLALFELTPEDGKSVGNSALRVALREKFQTDELTEEDYWDLRNSLIAEGKLEKGRGKGGSVCRVLLTEPHPLPTKAPGLDQPGKGPVSANTAEASLYEPFQKVIQTGFVPDEDLRPYICEITAFQGRRNTGGLWTRPDVTLIAIQTFVYVPGKLFEVITFEIKPNIETAMEGVYETVAHSAFAHRSYLAFPDSKEFDENPIFDRIHDECERFGLGLILFEDVANWDTYTFEVPAERKSPDPQAVNDFIKGQISEKSREEIQRWFR
ncbi:MAG: hypothetical protein WAN35_08825 [Terracidiphilus sp.]